MSRFSGLRCINYMTEQLERRTLFSSLNYAWDRVEIGPSGHFDGVVVHPTDSTVVYARSDVGGAYRLDRSTGEWTSLLDWITPDEGQNTYGSGGLGLDKNNPNVLFTAVGRYTNAVDGGLYKSTDYGATMTKVLGVIVPSNTDYREYGEPIAVDPNNSDVIYYGSYNQGAWVSTLGGDSPAEWSQISTASIPAGEVRSIAIDPTVVSGGKSQRIYVAMQDPDTTDATAYAEGVYYSSNGGSSWTLLADAPTRVSRMSVAADGRLFMSSREGPRVGVYRFTPGTGIVDNVTPKTYNMISNVAVNDFAYLNADENNVAGKRITQLPGVVAGTTMLQVSGSSVDNERAVTNTAFTLHAEKSGTWYLGYTTNLTAPAWITNAGFSLISGQVKISGNLTFNLYSKSVIAGDDVTFYGNGGSNGSHPHYLVFAKPGDGVGSGTQVVTVKSQASWKNFYSVDTDPNNANNLIATNGRFNDAAYFSRSTDGGDNWETIRIRNVESSWRIGELNSWNEPKYTVEFDPHNPGHVFAGDVFGLWDVSNVWDVNGVRQDVVTANVAGTGLNNNASLGLVATSGTAPVLTHMADVGGFRNTSLTSPPTSKLSINPGTYGLRNITDLDVSAADANVITAAVVDVSGPNNGINGQVHVSYNNGVSWTKVTDPSNASGSIGSPRVIISGGADLSGSGGNDNRKNWIYVPGAGKQLSYTTNGGTSWGLATGISTGVQPSSNKYTRLWIADSDKVTPGVFYVWHNTEKALYRSTDRGASYASMTTFPIAGDKSTQVRAVPGRAGEVWLALGVGGLWMYDSSTNTKTLNNGWDDVLSVAFGAPEVSGGNPTMFVHGKRAGVWGFYRSTDLGSSFVRFSTNDVTGYAQDEQMEADPVNFGRIYVAQPGSGYLYNTDDPSAPAPESAPQTVAAWNFNGYAAGTATVPADLGNGTFDLSNIPAVNRLASTGNTSNRYAGETAGTAAGVQSNANNGRYVQLSFSMAGLHDLKLVYAYEGFGGHFGNHAWSYSTDGTNFTPFTTLTPTQSPQTLTLDFSGIAALNDAGTVYLRDTMSGATLSTSASRFDNVHVIATPISVASGGETVVFSDDFGRADNSTVGNGWVETNSGSINASITGDQLVFTGTGSTGGSRSSVSQLLDGLSGFDTTLDQNTGLVTWRFNIRHDGEPGGLNGGRVGTAFVLAADAANFHAGNGADGYAVVIPQANRGQSVGTADPIRLVRFSNGVNAESSNVATYSPLITASSGVFADIDTNYLSVKVSYDPSDDSWTLYARDDGATDFANPTDETNAFTTIGSAIDATYTGSPLAYLGAFANNNGSGSSPTRLDNISLAVAAASSLSALDEDFDRADSSSIGNNWTEINSGNINAAIVGNQLTFDGTASTGGSRSSVSQDLAALPGFASTLDQNAGVVTWRFNVRHDNEPTGLNGGRFGTAFVLAADASNFHAGNGADGYAVVIAQADRGASTSTADPLQLVRFTNGVNAETSNVANYVPVVAATAGLFADIGTEYLSVKVTYEPATDSWSLYGRNDGSSAFADPEDESTAFTPIGTATDSTYTASAMSAAGGFVNNNGSGSPTVRYDNVSISISLSGGGGMGMLQALNSASAPMTPPSSRQIAEAPRRISSIVFSQSSIEDELQRL